MATILQCENLSFTYKNRTDPSLRQINLTVAAGEFILCTGATGCGKSTLLKTFNGLIPHEIGGRLQGSIRVGGEDASRLPVAELSRTVGLMFQNPDDQIFSMTVADEVGFALENMGMPSDEIALRVTETLQWVGLAGREKSSVHALSGGERQRLALAAVLAVRPQVLALDEPISQLDPQGAVELLGVLEKLNREHGITLIVVEHRLHEVLPLCRRVLVMTEGEVAWDGTRAEAFRDPEIFLGRGLRVPQTLHVCHALGIATRDASVETAAECITRELRPDFGRIACECPPTTASAAPFLAVKDLSFSYPGQKRKVLGSVNLQVAPGEFIALLGHNGAGKSTLLHHICGLIPAKQGAVAIDGRPLCGLDRRVGMVMQNPDLMLFNPTVEAEVTFGLKRRESRAGRSDEAWREILARIGLVGLEDHFPLALSQGQRVRTAIAALLVCGPKLFLLDEPTTGQDLGHIDDIMALLHEYVSGGGSVILCTHDTEVAMRHAERVVIMTDGKLVADASPREVFGREDILTAAGLRVPSAFLLSRRLYGGRAVSVKEVVRDVRQASMGSQCR